LNRSDADARYAHTLDNVEFRPIFIMGDHRSGTTVLYRLLDATRCFNVVTAYHIIRYGELLSTYFDQTQELARQQLSEQFAHLGVTDRMIDGVKVTPDLPEEYGFLLSATYRAQITPATLPRFVELCKKVQLVSGADRPLLLKNPWDYFLNFMYVKEAFPQAKFIFLHRDPLHVINSQIRAIRSSMQKKNAYLALLSEWYAQTFDRPVRRLATRLLFSPLLGLRIATRHVTRATNYVLEYTGALPPEDYISIRYEDLCETPESTVSNILEFAGLRPQGPDISGSLIDRRPLSLLPEVQRQATAIREQLRPYSLRYQYDT
jgi:hypothetical protein